MRSAYLFIAALFILSQDLLATPKSDSIVAFTGGARAKFVWLRWAWCNDDYTPKTEAKANADGRSLMFFDTDAGTERSLATGLGAFHGMRISRSGKWVTFIEGTKTYIMSLTASSPVKNVLLDKSNCTYWAVRAMWIDPANGTEYVYCLDNAGYPTGSSGTSIYKVKLNADGTADRSGATKLTINSTAKIDESFSISADGKKIGGAFPWPNTYILDVPTGRLDGRHNPGSVFGCQANLAPDNSYRLYHCEDDHLGIYMFAADMVNQSTLIDLSLNLDGVPSAATVMDFNSPRWSNHVQYYTATYPMGDNAESYCGLECQMQDGGSLWTKTATWVKTQLNMQKIPNFYLGKFSTDFKSQEKSIRIASDPRYMQYGGDGWICNGTTYGSGCVATSASAVIHARGLSGSPIRHSGSSVIIDPEGNAPSIIRIADAQARIVRAWAGTGVCAFDTRAFTAGTYVVSITTGNRTTTARLSLSGTAR